MIEKHIIAGSGGFIHEDYKSTVGPILDYAFALSRKKKPNFAFIGTAVGDSAERIANFYDACSQTDVHASHLELFPMPNHKNVEQFIMAQDVIWIEGGSVVNLLAVWRAHGLDVILKKAWEAGIILTGQSAGSICWNIGGTTDSFGTDLQPVTNGLGFLPYSSGVHFDSEKQRRPLFHKLIQDQTLPAGYATDDGVNLHFINTELHKAVSDTKDKYAYHIYRDTSGKVIEEIITPELLT